MMRCEDASPQALTDWAAEAILEAVEAYPPVRTACEELLLSARAMQAHSEVSWVRVGEWLEETADRLATPDPFMPHAQMDAAWLERNYRMPLEVARTFRAELP